jgi:hypothetical protein
MFIAKKDNSGNALKVKYIEGVLLLLYGEDRYEKLSKLLSKYQTNSINKSLFGGFFLKFNLAYEFGDFVLGYNKNIDETYKEINTWSENKKGIISNLIIGLLKYDLNIIEEEVKTTDNFFQKIKVNNPTFDLIRLMF